MLKIAICDDDKYFTGQLEKLLHTNLSKVNNMAEIDVFFNGLSLKDAFINGNHYDLIYLDIQMENLNGIDVANFIRKIDRTVLLIYISSFEQYLKKLFEVEAFRFLTKPVDEDLFTKYFTAAYDRIQKNNIYFTYSFNREVRKVPFQNIVYFESKNRVVYIYFNNGSVERFYNKLNTIEHYLQNQNQVFLRIHQSYLVNYNYVSKINFSSLVLRLNHEDECTLQISEDRQKQIRMQLCNIVVQKDIIL